MLYLILIFTFLSLAIYFLTLLFFIFSLLFIKSNNYKKIKIKNVSVIICVRNGQNSIKNVLNDLKKQQFLGEIEFIIVDDDSNDKTKEIILEFSRLDSRFKYVHSNKGSKNLSFKKKAIDAGIKNSQFDYLLFTDVDCRLKNNWAQSMMNQYDNNINYIIGCSIVKDSSKFVSKFQKIDFLMLMISAMASSNLKIPLACSGQNQSYKKDLYCSLNGFNNISHLLQGDDSIFMQLCKKKGLLNTVFNLNKESFVSSKIQFSWKSLFLQRIRWAGDANIMWNYNIKFYIILLTTFITNLFYLFIPIIFLDCFIYIIYFYSLKFIFELLLYYFGIKKIKEKFKFLDFILWFIIQAPYVVLVGILSFYANRFRWKGRVII